MEAKHTPGPWEISGSSRYGFDIAQAEGAPFTSNSSDVATVSTTATTHEMAQANAHLIAAAPELLQACDRTPNPAGSGTMSNYHILMLAVSALRAEGHMTLAAELEAIQEHQRASVAKATPKPPLTNEKAH